MLKKHFCVLITVFAVLVVFFGCFAEEKTEKPDAYDGSPWYRNLFEHWQTDGRLERINIGEHDFKKGVCSVCKSKIENLGDSFVLTNFNEDSNPRRETEYDPDGNVINEINYEYDAEGRLVNQLEHKYYYDENGILTNSKLFQRGALFYEYEYAEAKDGSVYAKKQICHDGENGSAIMEFDENGNCLVYNTFDKKGEKIQEVTSEYAVHPSGNYYITRETTFHYGRNEKIVYEYDEHYQYTLVITEDLEGTYYYEDVYENEYDENGNMVFQRRFQNGQLMEETYFREPKDIGYVIEKYITYGNDGSYKVFEYDINGNETSVTNYKDGTKGVKIAFGEYSSERIFKNGLNSFFGFGLTWKIDEISVSVKTESDSKYYDVYEWYWEEPPFSEEEWNSLFMEGEAFSLDGYENIKYQSIGADVFMLSADEELWFIQLFPDNRTENSFYVWSIDKLILLE